MNKILKLNNLKLFVNNSNSNSNNNVLSIKYYSTKDRFPTTMLNIKKKVAIDLTNEQYKLDEIEKKANELIKQEQIKQLKKQQEKEEFDKNKNSGNTNKPNLLDGFGLNNLKVDSFLEKELSNKQLVIDEQLDQERKLKVDAIKMEYSQQLKSELSNKQRLKIYNKFKSIQDSKTKSRLLLSKKSKTLSTVGKNKFEPFEKTHNIKELETIIEKFKNDTSLELSFTERIDLHCYSFQLYLKNNLFKVQFPMIYNNLNTLVLGKEVEREIRELVDGEDYYGLIALSRGYLQSQFKQGNLAYHYAFEYLKSKKKLWRFFQLLENPNFNHELDPLDFSEMVQVFLELDQIHSAEMLTSNMQTFHQNFYPDVFIHFFEYFNRQPNQTVSSITSEFLSTFKQFSFGEKKFQEFKNPIINEKKEKFINDKKIEEQELIKNQTTITEVVDGNEVEEIEDDENEKLLKYEDEFINKVVNEDEGLSGIPVRDIEMYKSILIHCYKSGYIEFAENLEEFMEKEGVELDLEMFNSKLKFQALEGVHISEETLNSNKYLSLKDKNNAGNGGDKKKSTVERPKFIGNSQTFQAILYNDLIVNQDVESAFYSLDSLKKKWSFKLNTFIINQLIYGLSRLNHIESAIKYYQMIPSSTNGNISKQMNQSIILYCMAYYNKPYNQLISFIQDSEIEQIDKPTLDLIIYGYLLDCKFKQDQSVKHSLNNIIDGGNSSGNEKVLINMVDNLIQVLNYLKNENLILGIDKESIEFIFSRLLLLRNQYDIKPSTNEFKLFKQLIK